MKIWSQKNCSTSAIDYRAAAVALALLVSAPFAPAQGSAQTGTVTGTVYNAATKANLANVEIRDEATGAVVVTEPDGSFILRLPAGEHRLRVTYGGLDSQVVVVTVAPGETAKREVALTSADYGRDVITLGEFVVASEKEGRAASVAQQKQADNLMSVISSDEFPNVAGGNIGDFLRNVPGISIEYSGADPRSISVRGMDPNMTSVSVNGMRAANAASANTNRQFELDQTSLQDVESIEIFKTPTASMDADAGGGAVNLVSKSAFKLKGRRMSYQALLNANSYDLTFKDTVLPDDSGTRKIRPGGSFAYSDSFFKNRLGVAFTANYNEFYVNSRSHNTNYGITSSISGLTTTDPSSDIGLHSRGFTYAINPVMTQRTSISLNLDFKLSDTTTLWSRNQVSTSLITGGGRSIDVGVNAPTAAGVATNGVAAGWSVYSLRALGDGTATAAAAATSSSSTFSHISGEYLDKSGTGTQFSLGSTTKTAEWKIDTAFSTSLSTNHYRNHGGMPVPQVDLYLRGISYDFSQPYGTNYPSITQTSGPSIYDLSNYVSRVSTSATSTVSGTNLRTLDSSGNVVVYPTTSIGTGSTATTYPRVFTSNSQYAPFQLRNGRRAGSKDVFNTAKFDAKRTFAGLRFPSYIQGGGVYRQQDRYIDRVGQTRWAYVGQDGIAGTADDANIDLGQFKSASITDTFGQYAAMPTYDLQAINAFFTKNRNLFKEDEAFRIETEGANNRKITEKVSAGYLMANTKIKRFGILLGARYELTEGKGTGPVADNEAARDAAIADLLAYVQSQGYATINAAPATVRDSFRADAAKLARIRYAKTVTASQDYDDVFPNVQLRFEAASNLLLRASYNKSIARQNFSNIIPGYTVAAPSSNGGSDRNTITINNTKLKPVYFDNYDFSVEYYVARGGLLAASVFYKDVANYTTNSTETIQQGVDYGYDLSGYIGDNLVRMANTGTAKQKGIELSYSQQLGVIHPLLEGFSAFASYTYQKGEANAAFGGTSTISTSQPISKLVPKMANAGVSYRHGRWSGSAKYNWKSVYYNGSSNSGNGLFALRYWDDRGTLDLGGSYKAWKNSDLFIEVKNATNEPLREFVVNRNWTRSYTLYGATIYLGVKGTF